MVSSIGASSINPIKMFNAVNAFKAVQAPQSEQIMQEVSDGLGVNDKTILDSQNLDEIKKFAKIAGEDNISNDDIQYGITYGRSVIADYIA